MDAEGTLLIDSHDEPVSEQVWSLYEELIARIGPRPTLIERDGELVIETLNQRVFATTRVFLLIDVTWNVTRRGVYTWRKVGDWRIEEARILAEQVRRSPIRFVWNKPASATPS